MISRLILFFAFILFAFLVKAQDSSETQKLPGNYLDKISSKINFLNQKVDRKNGGTVLKLIKQEEKIKRKLARTDSLKAKEIFGDIDNYYSKVKQSLNSLVAGKKYIPSLDTLITSLKFLEQNPQLVTQIKEGKQKLSAVLANVKSLENKFHEAEEIKTFLKERKQFLEDQLSKLGFAKQIKSLNTQIYYYSQQLAEYKSVLTDYKKAERKALELISQTKTFKNFMQKNSILASLFPLQDNINDLSTLSNLTGLQTRAQVNNLIQQQITAGGPNAQAQFNQNIQHAQSQLNELKNKIGDVGTNSSDLEIPNGFKPNLQKTKNFLQRIQLNADFQTTRHNKLFPVSSDLGLSIGYKLNDKSLIAIGSSFRIGWGTGFNNIQLTGQGASLRGGIDWKLKGNLFIAGSYEQNYFSAIDNIYPLQGFNNWKQAALLGLNKKYKSKKGKGGEIKILYDFFYNRPPIRTQPLTIRFGYNLK